MPSDQTILIIIAAALTLILTAIKTRKRLSKMDQRVARMRAVIREHSQVVRSLARQSLALRRKDKELEQQAEDFTNQCNEINIKITEAEKIDRRIYVLDDRKSPNDQSWIIAVMHPNYKTHVSPEATPELSMAWCTGKRYIVWAVDKDRAVDKLWSKLPKEKGFVITAVTMAPAEKKS